MASSLKFGTSGLRGLATELEGEEARRYAAAFVRYVETRGAVTAILVGRDLRESSAGIAHSVADALAALDVEVIDCGTLPTPALALESQRLDLPAIMVTGSHIPADRNGLKFYHHGEIDKTAEAGILAALDDAPSRPARHVRSEEALTRYRDRYAGLLPRSSLVGWRIGVWQHSLVMRDLMVEMLAHFGAHVVPLGRSETFVPVDTEAVSAETIAMLAGWVREHGLKAVVSSDGDADRPLIVDETGEMIRGDVVGILTAKFLRADVVVTPVTSNSSIEHTRLFKRVVRTRVGSPYVIAAMEAAREDGNVVGFEANGGVLLGSPVQINGTTLAALPTRDAMLPILAMLGAAHQAGSFSKLVASLPPRFARSDRLEHVPAERSTALMTQLGKDASRFFIEQGRVASVSDIDGLRFELGTGDVIHYRPSGNAPELRCYTEAATAARADALLAWGLKAAAKIVH
ncbi:MAG: phosphomannomutase [Devosia sp.]